ncbi:MULTISPECIES: lysylphosphatidylglycerol synthase domain-containing protein [unclassified Cyanobium]|uniref:lysylphosphatidylglycerol synthase domain-containing protein n=1 Tax=unclassified Cyanobium TaxID=2627006 RepID=UPI0020CBE4B5|nr:MULTISPECIES: lysylphosphatidylglycerol synthase domain-containing protein [unclassified Cyanobium]MCP9858487.1 flippase-like domain-containing protein [Cyanobium sp. Cruz-8H5]MCP9865429.1 flippase-like domain-containing protein [Cyanobium sp. Cruz-8D1]
MSRWSRPSLESLRRRLPTTIKWPALPALPALPGGLRPWITLGSLGFVMAALLSHGRQLLQLRLDGQGWLWLVLGVGVSLLSLLINGVAWGVILRWLGLRPNWAAVVELHLATNLRKFLPGGIWHLASRVQRLRSEGAPLAAPLSTSMALVAVLLDPLVAAVAALALVPLGGWQGGLGLVCLLPLALLLPRWLDPLLARLERRRARELGLEEELQQELAQASPVARSSWLRGYPWAPLLAELAFVLLRFAGFCCCIRAFDLPLGSEVPVWLAGFALAWTAGLVVPGAPGGLGVFEAVLLLRMGVALPEAPLLAVALSYRLIVTLTDLLAATLVALDRRLVRQPSAATPPSTPPSGSPSQ